MVEGAAVYQLLDRRRIRAPDPAADYSVDQPHESSC
jgi:hypothetical protein